MSSEIIAGLNMWDLVFIGMGVLAGLISLFCTIRVRTTFSKYSKVESPKVSSGSDIARTMLTSSGIEEVNVELVEGIMDEHFSNSQKLVMLSGKTYGIETLTAMGIAAHETGHAIQVKTKFPLFFMRTFFSTVGNFSAVAGVFLIIAGLILFNLMLVRAGLLLFFLSIVSYLIELPVEKNATEKAVECLKKNEQEFSDAEMSQLRRIMKAKELTYITNAPLRLIHLVGRALFYKVKDGEQ